MIGEWKMEIRKLTPSYSPFVKGGRKGVGILTLVFLGIFSPTESAIIHPLAGTTSASFLKIVPTARTASMAQSFGAVEDDISYFYYNPAGGNLSNITATEFTYVQSFADVNYSFLGINRYLPELKGSVGFAFFGLNVNNLERHSGLGENDPFEPITPVEGKFQANDFAAQVSYTRAMSEKIRAGISTKYIRQVIDTDSGQSFGFDIGGIYKISPDKNFGFSVSNIGPELKFIQTGYPLPLNTRFAFSWNIKNNLLLTAGLVIPNDNFPAISVGTEYILLKHLAIRVGYRLRFYGNELGELSGLSAGLGYKLPIKGNYLHFDYSFNPAGVLGYVNRFSVGIDFPKPEAKITPKSESVPSPVQKVFVNPVKEKDISNFEYFTAYSSFTPVAVSARGKFYRGEFILDDKKSLVKKISGNAPSDFPAVMRIGQNITGSIVEFEFGSETMKKITNCEIVLEVPNGLFSTDKLFATTEEETIPLTLLFKDSAVSVYTIKLGLLKPFYISEK